MPIQGYYDYIAKAERRFDRLELIRVIGFIYDPKHESLVNDVVHHLISIAKEFKGGLIDAEEFHLLRDRYITAVAKSCGSIEADGGAFWKAFNQMKEAGIILEKERQWYIERSRMSRWF